MYLRVEKLHRLEDDSWGTEARLVNLDHAGVLSVTRAGTGEDHEPMVIEVSFATVRSTANYYFGPADMSGEERNSRLSALHGALQGGPSVLWTMAKDAEARRDGHGLSSLAGL